MHVKTSVFGHFGEGLDLLNGQTVKTKIITEELQNQLGQDQVLKFDTHGGWKTLLKVPFQVFQALKKSSNVFVMPNCKKLTILFENELVYSFGVPYKLCTFSRVMHEKG